MNGARFNYLSIWGGVGGWLEGRGALSSTDPLHKGTQLINVSFTIVFLAEYLIDFICKVQRLEKPHGYLSSLNYPNDVISGSTCTCIIMSKGRHLHNITIHDHSLPSLCGQGYLSLKSGDKKEVFCQSLLTTSENIFISVSNLTLVEFNSSLPGRFLLEYKGKWTLETRSVYGMSNFKSLFLIPFHSIHLRTCVAVSYVVKYFIILHIDLSR